MRKTYFTLVAALLLSVLNLTASAQEKNQVVLSINAGAGIPVGDFSPVAKTGFGGLFDVKQFIVKRLAIGAQVGYFNLAGIPEGDDTTGATYRYHLVPIMGTIGYYFGDAKLMGGAGLGIGFNRFEATKTQDFETISTAGFKSCISSHVHGLVQVTPRISISMMVSYFAIFGSQVDKGHFGVLGGIAWRL